MKNIKAKICLLLSAVFVLSVVGGSLGSYAFNTSSYAEEAEEKAGYDIIYSSTNPVPEIAANVRPAVVQVSISAETWDDATRKSTDTVLGYGSGTYIMAAKDGNGGYILTNYHVVESGESYKITWLDGAEMECELVGYDDGTDIAILKFNENAPDNVTPVPFGDSDALQIGELAIVIGNPGASSAVLFGTVTAGIISGLAREDISAGNFSRAVSVIQTDASINTGNSGGALLNANGELVGIPTLKMSYSTSAMYEGLGFCVPINTVKDLITEIIETGKVSRPMLGVGVQDYDGPENPIKSHAPAGVMVMQLTEGGAAEEAGILKYDVITEIEGVRVMSYSELTSEIDKHEVGDTVKIKVYRYFDENGNMLSKYEEYTFDLELRALN